MSSGTRRPVRIGNCSGFLGDRLSAARELVDSGEIDVLTGDWLAELTMLILARQRMKRGPGAGYAHTFLLQMRDVLGACLQRNIKVVTNAGGLDPQGCADALAELAGTLGLQPRIAVVAGDDILDLVRARPADFPNLDTGETLGDWVPITANAYLGGEPVTAALAAGAEVVITGRITDAALVVGPAAWWHGWSYADAAAGRQLALDRLAGAVVAGHVIECGAQATGGNYAFFEQVPSWPAGFPIAAIDHDGSSEITKPSGSGGLVSVGTVTAQLLYEIGAARYLNPDVTARFDTIAVNQVGPDRVALTGTRGAPPPAQLKVAVNLFAGYRNTMALVLTGRDARAKADLALRMVTGLSLDTALAAVAGQQAAAPRELAALSSLDVEQLHVSFEDVAADDPASTAAAQGHLRLTVKDPDQGKVGKPFTSAVVESALGCYPGMFPTAPPGAGTPYGIYWPSLVPRWQVNVRISVAGAQVPFVPTGWADPEPEESASRQVAEDHSGAAAGAGASAGDPWTPAPGTFLGDIVGARSGDKGGDANVGVWIPEPGAGPSAGLGPDEVQRRFAWLAGWLTADRVRALLPEATALDIDVHPLPNLNAINVVVHGLLGRGVADSTSLDPQAKGLAEHLRARRVAG